MIAQVHAVVAHAFCWSGRSSCSAPISIIMMRSEVTIGPTVMERCERRTLRAKHVAADGILVESRRACDMHNVQY